jgi:putative membrane protein
MSKRSLFTAVVVLLCASMARADLSNKDKKFVENAAAGGIAEVNLGKFATEKASNQEVKDFGQKMVDDHTKANQDLMDFAKSKGVDLKDGEEKGTKQAQNQSAKLGKKQGADFDKEYMDLMVKDHEKDVKEFEDASKDAQDADLKAWAAKTLPTLQMHLQMAKDIQGKVKGK